MNGTKINFEQSFTKILKIDLDCSLNIAGQINKFCFKEYNKLLTGVYQDVPRRQLQQWFRIFSFCTFFAKYSDDVIFELIMVNSERLSATILYSMKKLYEISLSRMKILWPTIWIFCEHEISTDFDYADDYPFENTKMRNQIEEKLKTIEDFLKKVQKLFF